MAATVSQIRRTAKRLLRWCVVNGRLDERRARAVLGQVLQSKRRGYPTLLNEFSRLMKIEHAKHTAIVRSANPLTTDLQTRVRDTLERLYGEVLQTEFTDDRELIGGIRIQISSDVYDGTVKSRLTALATSFGIPRA